MRFRPAGRNPWTFPWQKKRNQRIDDAAMKIARGLKPVATQPSRSDHDTESEYHRLAQALEHLRAPTFPGESGVSSGGPWVIHLPEPPRQDARRATTHFPLPHVDEPPNVHLAFSSWNKPVTIVLPNLRASMGPEDSLGWIQRADADAKSEQ